MNSFQVFCIRCITSRLHQIPNAISLLNVWVSVTLPRSTSTDQIEFNGLFWRELCVRVCVCVCLALSTILIMMPKHLCVITEINVVTLHIFDFSLHEYKWPHYHRWRCSGRRTKQSHVNKTSFCYSQVLLHFVYLGMIFLSFNVSCGWIPCNLYLIFCMRVCVYKYRRHVRRGRNKICCFILFAFGIYFRHPTVLSTSHTHGHYNIFGMNQILFAFTHWDGAVFGASGKVRLLKIFLFALWWHVKCIHSFKLHKYFPLRWIFEWVKCMFNVWFGFQNVKIASVRLQMMKSISVCVECNSNRKSKSKLWEESKG